MEKTKTNTKTVTATAQEAQQKDFMKEVLFELSIRRKDESSGLPGDDPQLHNWKIGSSLRGNAPLSGLTLKEEEKYLPDILGISNKDVSFRLEKRAYWNNISEPVPHDDEGEINKFPGKYLAIDLIFTSKAFYEQFIAAEDFDAKADVLREAENAGKLDVAPNSTADYVLFRYCLVYSRVANNKKDMHKSAKIWFYLYSRETDNKRKYNEFTLKKKADKIFESIMDEEDKLDGILRLFGKNPDDTFLFENVKDKQLALDELISTSPEKFISYAKDSHLKEKALIKQASALSILHNPANTDSYYFGDDKSILLGTSLSDAVLFLKNSDEKNKQILESIESQIRSFKK